jgi:hypothetical protein
MAVFYDRNWGAGGNGGGLEMGSEKAPKSARRPSTPSVEKAEEIIPEIIAGRSSDDFHVQTECIKDVLEDDVRSRLVESAKLDRHHKLLANADNMPILDYIWKQTAFGLRRESKIARANQAQPYVCVREIGEVLWQAEENRQASRAERTGVPTPYQVWEAAEGDAKEEAREKLDSQKQKFIMRAKRVVDAAKVFRLVTKETIRNNNLVAIRGTPLLNKMMTTVFLLGRAAKWSPKKK